MSLRSSLSRLALALLVAGLVAAPGGFSRTVRVRRGR